MTAHARRPADARGFSLIEMIITLSIMAMVVAALSTVLIRATASRLASANRFESLQTARSAADLIARDLRSAGYGVDQANGQPAIAYIDSTQVLMCENAAPWPDDATPGAPESYDPDGSPRPKPLVGSDWTPPLKYGTGAEIIRYTLDLNDDGSVDASDVACDEGADARRSRCPDDYTLVRQVYGAGSGGVASNNGGSSERIALVLKPGGEVAPLFTVFFTGSSAPWDWSLGPVPAARLHEISRIEIKVTAASSKADSRGAHARSVIETAVRSLRNKPDFGGAVHVVDGYVFEDENLDRVRNTGERGLPGALVRLGSGRVSYTNDDGYYAFRVPTGQYVLRHVAPSGFGSFSDPDSFELALAGAESRSFADTSRSGGWVAVSVWEDTDSDGAMDAGESALPGVAVAASGGAQAVTDANGEASLFVPAGAWSIAVTAPAGYSATTSNPATGVLSAGGSQTARFGLHQASATALSGRVFNDSDGSGTFNGAETGRSGVTVTAYVGTSTVHATTTTDAAGRYSFSLPTPSPGSGTSYSVGCAPVAGLSPTTSLLHSGIVPSGTALSGYDFGFSAFSSTSVSSSLVPVVLVAADVWENDGSGSTPSTRGDVDLVAVGARSSHDLFGYAPNSWTSGAAPFSRSSFATSDVDDEPFALLVDTLRRGSTPRAPDAVVGTDGGDNFEIWLRSGSGMPTSPTRRYCTDDEGDVRDVVALDCSGGTQLDLIVGTRSSSSRGTIEIWQSDDGTSPRYSRREIYPSAASIPGGTMGYVVKMVLADFDLDGDKDLVVATGTGSSSGELILLDNIGRTDGSRFRYRNRLTFSSDLPQALGVADFDGDGLPDVVLGTRTGSSSGRVLVYRNTHASSSWTLASAQAFSAPGQVLCLAAADLGGDGGNDLALGYATSSGSGGGGVRLYYNVGGALSTSAVDPSGGTITKSVVAMATGNFNCAASPATAGPWLTDLAIAWKHSSTTAYYVVYTR